MPACNQCGREVQEKDQFCPYCGGKLARSGGAPAITKEEGQFCTNCGKLNKPNFQFCLHCGQKLKKTNLVTDSTQTQIIPSNSTGSEKLMTYCGNCGESMKPNALFCIHCGYKKPVGINQQKKELDAQTVIIPPHQQAHHLPMEKPVENLPPVNPQLITNPSLSSITANISPPQKYPEPVRSVIPEITEKQIPIKELPQTSSPGLSTVDSKLDSESIRKIAKDMVLSEEVLSLLEARLNNHLLSQVQEQLESRLKPEIELKLRAELESQIRKELISELTPEITDAIKKELEKQIREEYTPIYREALEKQIKPDVEKNLEEKLTPDLRNRIFNHLTPVIQREIREKELLDIRRKLEAQLRPVIQQELMIEMEKKRILEEQQKSKRSSESVKNQTEVVLPQFQPFPNPFQMKNEQKPAEKIVPASEMSEEKVEKKDEEVVEEEVVEEEDGEEDIQDELNEKDIEKTTKQKMQAI